MVSDRSVVEFHARASERPVLGGTPFHPHAPQLERTEREFMAHELDHFGLRQSNPFMDRFKGGSVFPRHLNHGRDVSGREAAQKVCDFGGHRVVQWVLGSLAESL